MIDKFYEAINRIAMKLLLRRTLVRFVHCSTMCWTYKWVTQRWWVKSN